MNDPRGGVIGGVTGGVTGDVRGDAGGNTAGNAPGERPVSGDELPQGCAVIRFQLQQISQLFDSLDPAPFHEKDLDTDAVEYIIGSAEELPENAPLAAVVQVARPAGDADEGRVVGNAIRDHFARQALLARRQLRQLLRRGWISLGIGVAFLTVALGASALLEGILDGPLGTILRESVLIGGWVAMWRPLETFLYDWWPVAGRRRLYGRLSRMAVRIEYAG